MTAGLELLGLPDLDLVRLPSSLLNCIATEQALQGGQVTCNSLIFSLRSLIIPLNGMLQVIDRLRLETNLLLLLCIVHCEFDIRIGISPS